jgi:hypothetical protein
LVKVDIVRWGTPVTKQFNIRSVPSIRVYNRSGKPVGKPTHQFNQVVKNVAKAR